MTEPEPREPVPALDVPDGVDGRARIRTPARGPDAGTYGAAVGAR